MDEVHGHGHGTLTAHHDSALISTDHVTRDLLVLLTLLRVQGRLERSRPATRRTGGLRSRHRLPCVFPGRSHLARLRPQPRNLTAQQLRARSRTPLGWFASLVRRPLAGSH